jgi:hypothetical protein
MTARLYICIFNSAPAGRTFEKFDIEEVHENMAENPDR